MIEVLSVYAVAARSKKPSVVKGLEFAAFGNSSDSIDEVWFLIDVKWFRVWFYLYYKVSLVDYFHDFT